MIAVVGVPGSRFHDYRYFSSRAEGLAWLAREHQRVLDEHPAAGPQPARLISDRASQGIRWQDGQRVYPWGRQYPGAALRWEGDGGEL